MGRPKKRDPNAPRRGYDMTGGELTAIVGGLRVDGVEITQGEFASWFGADARALRKILNEGAGKPVAVSGYLAVLARAMHARPDLAAFVREVGLSEVAEDGRLINPPPSLTEPIRRGRRPSSLPAKPAAPTEKPKRGRKPKAPAPAPEQEAQAEAPGEASQTPEEGPQS